MALHRVGLVGREGSAAGFPLGKEAHETYPILRCGFQKCEEGCEEGRSGWSNFVRGADPFRPFYELRAGPRTDQTGKNSREISGNTSHPGLIFRFWVKERFAGT
jgi:hypothetical protein